MLSIANLSKSFNGPDGIVQALVDFSLDVRAGEFVAVRGPSGSGKSTLLLAAGGLLHPDSGRILLGGQDLYALTGEARARVRAASIGFVFQQFHLIPYLTVLENALAPAVALDGTSLRARALSLLDQFGLAGRVHHHPGQLSTGERQRTALARALLHKPGLVLADEPTGNLDEENGRVVIAALRGYVQEGGALLLVTHDRAAADLAHRVVELPAARKLPAS